jgi:hypothetical protein
LHLSRAIYTWWLLPKHALTHTLARRGESDKDSVEEDREIEKKGRWERRGDRSCMTRKEAMIMRGKVRMRITKISCIELNYLIWSSIDCFCSGFHTSFMLDRLRTSWILCDVKKLAEQACRLAA